MAKAERLFVRAVLAFLAFPAVVGLLAPWSLARSDPWLGNGCSSGLPLAALGAAGLVWCVCDFYAVGKGTLAPWAPPERLVVVGLYRIVRNPMYMSVVVLVAGTALWRTSPLVGGYAAVLKSCPAILVAWRSAGCEGTPLPPESARGSDLVGDDRGGRASL